MKNKTELLSTSIIFVSVVNLTRRIGFIIALTLWFHYPGMLLAQTLDNSRQGNFSVEIVQSGSWEGFEIGHRHWVWIARRSGSFKGEGILDGLLSNCISKGKTLFGFSEATVHCENIDAEGDKIYETSSETGVWVSGGKGGTGSGKFIGGTGKYELIRGSFEIVRKVGPRDVANRSWTDYVSITGSWNLP